HAHPLLSLHTPFPTRRSSDLTYADRRGHTAHAFDDGRLIGASLISAPRHLELRAPVTRSCDRVRRSPPVPSDDCRTSTIASHHRDRKSTRLNSSHLVISYAVL